MTDDPAASRAGPAMAPSPFADAEPRSHGPRTARPYQLLVVAVMLAYLAWDVILDPSSFARPVFIPWLVAMAFVSLFPLPVWRETRVGMEFPLSIALGV